MHFSNRIPLTAPIQRESRDFQLYQLPLTNKHNRIENNMDIDILLEDIYASYDFKFGCNFKQQQELKLLAYAKPLIQYFIDKLINEISTLNQKESLAYSKMENLINAFTPMYINRLARFSDEIIEADLQIGLLRNRFSSTSTGSEYEFIVIQIQNKNFIEYLHCTYPEFFSTLIQISDNWLAFILEFYCNNKEQPLAENLPNIS